MNEKKKEIAKEIFSPVIKKFQRIQNKLTLKMSVGVLI